MSLGHVGYCTYRTAEPVQFVDITDDVREIVRRSNVVVGQVVVQCLHTTTGIIVNEDEENLLRDFSLYIETKIPKEKWTHDHIPGRKDCEPDEPENAKAHIIAAFFSQVSVALAVSDSDLVLGRFQRIFFAEFDGPCPRPQKTERKVVVSVVGSA
ncbi:MAG: secondary thiamine-phosphate synthase enzyme YjbQ [Acidobacteriota bacterium]